MLWQGGIVFAQELVAPLVAQGHGHTPVLKHSSIGIQELITTLNKGAVPGSFLAKRLVNYTFPQTLTDCVKAGRVTPKQLETIRNSADLVRICRATM